MFSQSVVANGQQTERSSNFCMLNLWTEKAELAGYFAIAMAIAGGVHIHATGSLPRA